MPLVYGETFETWYVKDIGGVESFDSLSFPPPLANAGWENSSFTLFNRRLIFIIIGNFVGIRIDTEFRFKGYINSGKFAKYISNFKEKKERKKTKIDKCWWIDDRSIIKAIKYAKLNFLMESTLK